jgi:putative adhesin
MTLVTAQSLTLLSLAFVESSPPVPLSVLGSSPPVPLSVLESSPPIPLSVPERGDDVLSSPSPEGRGGQGVRTQEFRWKGKLAAGKAIEVKGVNGDVAAVAASGSEAEVTAVKRAKRSDPDEVKIEVVEHEGGVTICAVYPSAGRRPNECKPDEGDHMNTHDNDVSVAFTVHVPAGVRFVGRTVNGGVEAAKLAGDVQAFTVNGSIHISTSGSAEARTVNGSIVAAMGRATWSDEVEFRTVNGGITLDLPSSLSAVVRAETVNGDIVTDFPLTVTGRLGPRRVTGTIGGGGRQLALSTVNGNIRLRKTS